MSYERPSAWYPNRGGQLALSTIPHADLFALGGSAIELQPLVATHAGRAGDGDVELVRIDLLFEEHDGDPLSTPEANGLIEKLSIYRDDGSGLFEVTGDTLVAVLNSLTLTDGIQSIAFSDGDPNARVVHGSPVTYFTVVELTPSAAGQTPNRFRLTHQTEEGAAAEDRDHDLPLELQATAHVPSGYYTAVGGVAGSTSGLQIQKVTPARIHPYWDASCSGADIDYAIYRGFMTDFTAHASLHCTTGGALDLNIGLGPGDLYYLIVPTDGLVDGSYGQGQNGERPVGVQVCRTQSLET